MIRSLLYVSRKMTLWPDDDADLAAITEVSRARNAGLDVTGALISADRHFAQILEGPPAAVDDIMVSIHRDRRHSGVTLLQQADRQRRWFAKWSLAYAGRASYVALGVAPLLDQAQPDRRLVERLIKLIRGFERVS